MATQKSNIGRNFIHRISLLLIMVGSALVMVTLTSIASFDFQTVERGKQIFDQQCVGCHTIGGGPLVGPDLAGVTAARDRLWLQEFILDPNTKFDSGDELANQLLVEYNNIRMPNLGLTAADVDSILLYLENSSGEVQPPAEAAPSLGGAASGKKLFTGEIALVNGGTPCIACHSVEGIGLLDGGTLGPDLTKVVSRYTEPGLSVALTTISFPSMIGIFTNSPLTAQETADLVAFFIETNKQPAPAAGKTLWYFAIAAGIAVLLYALLLLFWPRQRESISDKLRAGKIQPVRFNESDQTRRS